MKRLDLIVFLIIALSLGLIGCGSDKLSRGKAKDIIIDTFHTPSELIGNPYVVSGKISQNHQVKTYERNKQDVKYLFKKKLIKSVGKTYDYRKYQNKDYQISRVSLTEKAAKYSTSKKISKKYPTSIRLALYKFIEVTGISPEANKTEAIVEYTWSYDKLTPFGKAWEIFSGIKIDPEIKYKRKIILRLYDDGWRFKKTLQFRY